MAVITELHRSDIDHVLAQYELGSLVNFRETTQGIENSNYFVLVEQDGTKPIRTEYVLTVLENHESNNHSLVLAALEHSSKHGLPVPAILQTRDAGALANWQDLQVLLSPRISGNHVIYPTKKHCAAIGRFLARLHLILNPLTEDTPYERDFEWLKSVSVECEGALPSEESSTLRRVISLLGSLLNRNDVKGLPQGIIHGDLFRDNALFNQLGLCGVLDFHHAGCSFWLFDIAVAINDWCWESGKLNQEKTFTMLREYNAIRKLDAMEYWCFPYFLLYAAAAFWLSRLAIATRKDLPKAYPRKDPKEFAEIVQEHLMHPFQIHELVMAT